MVQSKIVPSCFGLNIWASSLNSQLLMCSQLIQHMACYLFQPEWKESLEGKGKRSEMIG